MKPHTLYRKAMEGTLFRKIEALPSEDRSKAERTLHYAECQESVDFCLNCKGKKCNGDCVELRRFKRENNLSGKYVRSPGAQQRKTHSNAKKYPYKGKECTIRELAAMANVCHDAMYKRIVKRGMSAEEAVALGNQHAGYKWRSRLK